MEPLTATVTLLFCDLVESTALASGLGDAAADDLRHDVFDALRAEVTAYRGTEVKNLGDGLMVSFTSNADAVRAACGMQQEIDVAWPRQRQLPLALRVGISVGEATFEDDDWFGTPVVEASRLCSAASSGPGARRRRRARAARKSLRGDAAAGRRAELKGLPDPRRRVRSRVGAARCAHDPAAAPARVLDRAALLARRTRRRVRAGATRVEGRGRG